MRTFLALFICRVIRFIGIIFKRGSSLPGEIALKIDPKILDKVHLPKYVIAVSGSNGKTSTVEMIKEVIESSGMSVAFNYEGSNQIEGVTTLVLCNCDNKLNFKKDVLLLESDERYARHIFNHFVPTHYIITNLYRDQLTRNGHPEWIFNILQDSIHDGCKMLINCDDPLVNNFKTNDAIYFGINRYSGSTLINTSVYNDGKYCPVCKKPMNYSCYHFNHIGNYQCSFCGYERNNPKYRITEVDLNKGYIEIDGTYKINLALKSLYNAYNILAAYSLGREIGIDGDIICKALNNYILKNGRVVEFIAGNNKGTLLASKHENSISYNQSLSVIKNYKEELSVLIMVDAISRKYFTSETSWLWDIDFEMLNDNKNIKNIIITGLYANDVAERLLYANVDFDKVVVESDIDTTINYLKENELGHIFAITCFSDLHKLLDKVEVIK